MCLPTGLIRDYRVFNASAMTSTLVMRIRCAAQAKKLAQNAAKCRVPVDWLKSSTRETAKKAEGEGGERREEVAQGMGMERSKGRAG